MTLAAGSRLGPYEIVAPLGAGGMGEVYQARDARLDREVALKILPEGVAAPAVFARFQREARLCSSLSHPNIVTVHELAEEGGTPYIAMELVRGDSLRALLGRRLPPKRAIALAAQIADALAAAHGCGIVHRDLKPENVMVTANGSAKVLDFGVARLESGPAGTMEATDVRLTTEGSLLGTIAYMSPEQARGEYVDFRSDQFSFGVMLYEMLAGRNPFARASVAATAAAILGEEPGPLDRLTGVSPSVAAILERCLAKEPAERYASTADLAHDVRHAGVAAPARAARVSPRIWWALPLVLLAVAGAFALGRYLDRDRAPTVIPMTLDVAPDDLAVALGEVIPPLAISPDGGRLLLAGARWGTPSTLWIHDLGSGTTARLEGSDNGHSGSWNEDGTEIAFFAEGKLKTISVGGGTPRVVCDANPEGNPAWHGDTIVFMQAGSGIWSVAATGGTPKQIVARREGREPYWPEFLPDGRHFIFLDIFRRGSERTHELMLGSIDGEPPRPLASIDSLARWSDTGHLLYVRDGTVFAQPFDLEALRLEGEPVPLASGVHYFFSTGLAAISVSKTGVLVWRRPAGESELTWVDRRGSVLEVVGREARFEEGHMSDDGEQYATAIVDEKRGLAGLWRWDVARGSGVRISFSSYDEKAPVWAPGGLIVYRSDEEGPPDVFIRRPGSDRGEPFIVRPGVQEPLDVSPDGRWLLFVEWDRKTGGDLWVAPMNDPAKARPFILTPSQEASPRFSPDGAWVAYQSDAAGSTEIYVRSFDDPATTVRVSNAGGAEPRWRGDGRELYYIASGGITAIPMERAGASIRPGEPEMLFRFAGARDFEVAPAGDRFLIRSAVPETRPPIRILTDWRAAVPITDERP